jgi:hypothetical protein
VLEHSVTFVKSFLAYAGRQAWVAATLVLAAAALEGIGILLVVPFLAACWYVHLGCHLVWVSPYLQAVNHVRLRLRLKAEGHEP